MHFPLCFKITGTSQLPAPKKVWLLLANIILVTCIIVLTSMEIIKQYSNTKDKVFYNVVNTLYLIFNAIITFAIGLFLENFTQDVSCRLLVKDGQLSLMSGRTLFDDFRAVKGAVSPFLFAAFFSRCLLLIRFAISLLLSSKLRHLD